MTEIQQVSHFTYENVIAANVTKEGFLSTKGSLYLRISPDRLGGETWSDVTAYLDAQKAAGTPVQVLDRLETPYTIQLDPQTLDMLRGYNTIWCRTGSTTVGYVADTQMYVESHGGGSVEYAERAEYADRSGDTDTVQGVDVVARITHLEDCSQMWEYIATVTLDSEQERVTFDADSAGEPFALRAFYINLMAGAIDGTSAKMALRINGKAVMGTVPAGLSATALRRMYVDYIIDRYGIGYAHAMNSIANTANYPNVNTASVFSSITPPGIIATVNKVELDFNVGDNKTFTSGSTFELYGVRA